MSYGLLHLHAKITASIMEVLVFVSPGNIVSVNISDALRTTSSINGNRCDPRETFSHFFKTLVYCIGPSRLGC